MPIDRSHQHISSDIVRVDAVHTPIDPNGGGGPLSVTDGTTTVAATGISQPTGTVVEVSAGVASLLPAVFSDGDPGAVGPGVFWFHTNVNGSWVQLNVRDENDADWINVTPLFDTNPGTQVFGTPDGASGQVSFNDESLSFEIDARTSEGNGANYVLLNARNDAEVYANVIRIDATGITIGATGAAAGFFGAAPVVRPTGVAVTAEGIHAALVSLGLISA